MRHGPAEDHAASGRDFDRALTASGRERVRDVARALVEGGEAPLVILTSPLVRALQTAEIVAGVVQLAEEKGGEAASVESGATCPPTATAKHSLGRQSRGRASA